MVREPTTSRRQAGSWLSALVLTRVLTWPIYAVGRLRKVRRPSDRNLKRLRCKALFRHAKGTGTRVAFLATGFVELGVAREVTAILRESIPDLHVTFGVLDVSLFPGLDDEAIDLTPFPFDSVLSVGSWLCETRPDVVVLQEIARRTVPVLLTRSKGFRVVLLNGRDRSVGMTRGWVRGAFRRALLGSYSAIGLESPAHVEALRSALPQTEVVVTGMAKPLPSQLTAQKRADLHTRLSGRPLFAAGSVEEEEVAFVIEAFRPLAAKARLLLAPRRLEQVDSVLEAAREAGLKAVRRSQASADEDVVVLDTIGELAAAYGESVAAFVGGTLCGKGHNVMEPLVAGVGLAFGPNPGSSVAVQHQCQEAAVGTEIHSTAALASFWEAYLSDADLRRDQERRAHAFVAARGGAMQAAAALVARVLSP